MTNNTVNLIMAANGLIDIPGRKKEITIGKVSGKVWHEETTNEHMCRISIGEVHALCQLPGSPEDTDQAENVVMMCAGKCIINCHLWQEDAPVAGAQSEGNQKG